MTIEAERDKAMRSDEREELIKRHGEAALKDGPEHIIGHIREAVRDAISDERQRCALVALTQHDAPGTRTGERQKWVKEQIAHRIRAGEVPK